MWAQTISRACRRLNLGRCHRVSLAPWGTQYIYFASHRAFPHNLPTSSTGSPTASASS